MVWFLQTGSSHRLSQNSSSVWKRLNSIWQHLDQLQLSGQEMKTVFHPSAQRAFKQTAGCFSLDRVSFLLSCVWAQLPAAGSPPDEAETPRWSNLGSQLHVDATQCVTSHTRPPACISRNVVFICGVAARKQTRAGNRLNQHRVMQTAGCRSAATPFETRPFRSGVSKLWPRGHSWTLVWF